MACRYTYQGKTYEAYEFDDILRAMKPETASQYMPSVRSIPIAPFVTNTDKWLSLALKRIIKLAVDEGYAKVAFINGEQSADRYDLSKSVDEVMYSPQTQRLIAKDAIGREVIRKEDVKQNDLPDLIGKDAAEKIMKQQPTGIGNYTLKGAELKLGGEGMKAFYDKIVPNTLKDVLRKVGGGQVEPISIDTHGKHSSQSGVFGNTTIDPATAKVEKINGAWRVVVGDALHGTPFSTKKEAQEYIEANTVRSSPQPGFTITEKMKEQAADGLPMFKKQASTGMSVEAAQAIVDKLSDKIDVTVVATPEDLPVPAPSDAKGLYHNGKAWIVASNNANAREVAETYAHEVIGHYGLRNMLGREAFAKTMGLIQLALKSGNKPLNAIRDQIRKTYVDENGKFNLTPNQEADEIAAAVAQNAIDENGNIKAGFGFMKAVYAKIAQFLRDMGIDIKFTNTELQGLLTESLRQLGVGEKTNSGNVTVLSRKGADLLTPYTESEARAKQEREEQARKDEQRQSPNNPAKNITADQVDMFNNQESLFSRSDIKGSSRRHTPDQLSAMNEVGFVTEKQDLKEKLKEYRKDIWKKLEQGIVDQFAPVKDISKEAYGLMRLSKGAAGAFETILKGGKLKLINGVYAFDNLKKGGVIDRLLKPLQGEHHDFLRWVAANRAERLMGEGKENLFTQDSITKLKTLSDGTTDFDYKIKHGADAGKTIRDRNAIYKDSLITFNEFNKNVLDMAEKSGLIDGESRTLWEHEFYVPFYRVSEDGFIGGGIKSGVIRQQAFKALKGGSGKLNDDLLDNTLNNWAKLLDAAAKNRAAKATIEAAEKVGAAIGSDQATLKEMSLGKKKNVVWFMDGGDKRYSLINTDDGDYLLTAISSLEYAGMDNPVMNAMSMFKHALTVGVTASPFFKVRNLIRDSVQAIGTSGLSYNPVANVKEGWNLTNPKSDAYFNLLAGGGTIHFGSMLEGSETKRVESLVAAGVDRSTILDDEGKIKEFYRTVVLPLKNAYNDLGDRGEAVNRASLYAQLMKPKSEGGAGLNHAEASLQARDLMDFSMQGSFATIRFLTQVVPFMNARIQGLYKIGKSAKEDPQKIAIVLGATALLSIGLLLAYHDDDDWKKREDWDRNNFWWIKVGGKAFRIPKPFEIGAMATLAERGFELGFDKEMTSKRFRDNVLHLLSDNLSLNPIPQLVKPIIDVYSNKSSLNGSPIESLGMERLQADYRFNDRTTMAARGLSTGLNSITGLVGASAFSPVQIDYMLKGYFGWLGAFVIGGADIIARPATNQPNQASSDTWKMVTGNMVSDLRDAPSRYVSQMYAQAKEIEQSYGTYKDLVKQGKNAEAQNFFEENKDDLKKYRSIERVKRGESVLNERVRMIERSNLEPETKREMIRQIQVQKNELAKLVN